MNVLTGFLSGVGQSITGDLSSVENYALEAFYIVAGLLLIQVVLTAAILLYGIAVAR